MREEIVCEQIAFVFVTIRLPGLYKFARGGCVDRRTQAFELNFRLADDLVMPLKAHRLRDEAAAERVRKNVNLIPQHARARLGSLFVDRLLDLLLGTLQNMNRRECAAQVSRQENRDGSRVRTLPAP
jgi:hypothetical protein